MEQPVVEATGLTKRYGHRTAVAEVSLQIPAGQVTAILGPNGAGKTTTLEMCEGFRVPDRGSVRVFGADPAALTRQQRAAIGIMLQAGGVWTMARPEETIRHVAGFYSQPRDPDELLDRLFLRDAARTPFRRLSGGEQQRVKLACALVGRPSLVFLDEPTAGLDPHARRAVWDLIAEERQRGAAVVLSTHLMDDAERLADHIWILDKGRVVTHGSPKDLTEQSGADEILITTGVRVATDDLVAALPEGNELRAGIPGVYHVSGEVTPLLLGAVSAWCAENGIPQHAITIRRQTLEDVFLSLTAAREQP